MRLDLSHAFSPFCMRQMCGRLCYLTNSPDSQLRPLTVMNIGSESSLFEMNSSNSMSQREDNFDSAPLLNSQSALVPETSLHVTRQFPSYVDSFIRWLINSAPARSDSRTRGKQTVFPSNKP
ncbi:hypothetical protein BIW11_10979 [Tropilaelaps mercedesae]|uniref:Uncharacterized protein n=1 Tax=Tropilaelaps mercedesae TaxID=418985 RepID=A0A1V9XDI0_9ACAR|nr:hypothetical protein BIW11_10979 [Tropilaelaps mercedesae]